MVYLPVIRTARLGAHVTAPAYHRRKRVPCRASLSRLGVFHSLRPLNPTSLHPRSSARIKSRFGGRAANAEVLAIHAKRQRIRELAPGLQNLIKLPEIALVHIAGGV